MFESETKLDSLEDSKLNAEQKFSASQTIRYYSHYRYHFFTQHCQDKVNRTLQSEFYTREIKHEPQLPNRVILRKFQNTDNFASKIIINS